MDIRTVACNNCGAALQIDDHTRFVTCRHCGSQLEIKRTSSTISTELLESIDRRTASIADDVHSLRHASDLERLDREWAARRNTLLVSNKQGQQSIPTKAGGIAVTAIMGGFGLFWTVMSCWITGSMTKAGAPLLVMAFPLFGLVFIGVAITLGLKMMSAAETYNIEESRYQAQREEVLAKSTATSP